MSVVSEEVVTSEAVTPPETQPERSSPPPAPAIEASGTPPSVTAAAPVPAPASETQSDFMSMFKELSEGDVVVGTVVRIDKDGVLVDVGSKSEGIIRPNELSREPFTAMEDVVHIGEDVKVVVIGRDAEDGSLLLSKKRADFEKAWDKVIEAMNDGTILHAMVTDRVKGGLTVDLGIRGFVPASHVGTGDFKHQNLDKHVGQSIALKVIEVDRERRKVILSNRLATQEEREQRRVNTVSSLKEGDIRHGVVRRVTDYGAFIDLGGIDGLLHVSEMSWTRIKHPSEVLHNGQELDVKVLKLKLDQGRVSLGLRDILPDPWLKVGERYKVGDTIKVAVSRLVPFGAFVALDEGVEAIIPNSELSDRRVNRPDGIVAPGDEVEAIVIEVRAEERKMTLSIRRLMEINAPREPFVPEIDTGAGGGGRSGREREDRRGERSTGYDSGPSRDGGSRDGGRDGGANREASRAPNRETRRRERTRDSGGYSADAEDDYREYKNYRANQREETFGTSLADVLGEQFGKLREEVKDDEDAQEEPTEEPKE